MAHKLLYLGAHGILEYYEIKMFHQMGFDVRSVGDYVDPLHPKCEYLSKPLPELPRDLEFISRMKGKLDKYPSYQLNREIVKDFDIVVVCHDYQFLANNFQFFMDKIIIWRTVGQVNPLFEHQFRPFLPKLNIVRWSSLERLCPGYIGDDAIIRCPIDSDLYNGSWTGDIAKILTVKNCLNKHKHTNEFYKWAILVAGSPNQVIGLHNEDIPDALYNLTPDQLREFLRRYRVNIVLPSSGAPYTLNFFESLMMGIPVVILGKGLVGSPWYEQAEIIEHGINGFCSNELIELRRNLQELLSNHELAERVGREGTKLANKLVSYPVIKEQWKSFFRSIGVSLT